MLHARLAARLCVAFRAVLVAVLLVVSSPSSALAHTMPGGLTLLQLSRAADVIAIARISRTGPQPHGQEELPPVEAEILEVLRGGDAKPGKIVFAPHRHADENYAPGEEVLLFLEPKGGKEKDPAVKYQSVEAIADRIVLEPKGRAAWIEAARAYTALGKGPRAQTDAKALGRVTVKMLGSGERRIASLALRDLTLSGDASLVGADDAPLLLGIVDDVARPASFRVGLLLELERRKLVPMGARWVDLLKKAPPEDLVTVIRAAGSRSFVPDVTAELVVLLGQTKGEAAVACARALGGEGNEAAVPALVAALSKEPPELRYAALGSLRRIGTAAARAEVEKAAASHPDEETRRVAATERNLFPPPSASADTPGSTTSPASERRSGVGTWILLGLLFVFGVGALVVSALRRVKSGDKQI